MKLRTRGKRPNSIAQTTTVTPTESNTDQPFYKERKIQNSESSKATPEKVIPIDLTMSLLVLRFQIFIIFDFVFVFRNVINSVFH